MYLLESSCVGHSGPINSVTFNHDGDLIASGSMSLRFITNPGANQVPTGDDGHMMVWKCENGECTHNITIGSPILRVLWVTNSTLRARKKSLLFLGCQDGSIHLYRADLERQIVCPSPDASL